MLESEIRHIIQSVVERYSERIPYPVRRSLVAKLTEQVVIELNYPAEVVKTQLTSAQRALSALIHEIEETYAWQEMDSDVIHTAKLTLEENEDA